MVGHPTLVIIKQLTRLVRVDGKTSMIGIQQALSMFGLCEIPNLPKTDEGC